MKALYGFSNHSPPSIKAALQKKNELRVQTLTPSDSVNPKAEVILVPTVKVFLKNRQTLVDSRATVFVFDASVPLSTLTGMEILDATRLSPIKYRVGSFDTKILRKKLATQHTISPTQKPIDTIAILLASTAPSVMKPILTFLYSVSDVERRNLYRFHILRFFSKPSVTLRKLESTLIKLSSAKNASNSLSTLLAFLRDDKATNVKEVLTRIKKAKRAREEYNTYTLCREHNVSAFDVKYITKAYKADKANFRHLCP